MKNIVTCIFKFSPCLLIQGYTGYLSIRVQGICSVAWFQGEHLSIPLFLHQARVLCCLKTCLVCQTRRSLVYFLLGLDSRSGEILIWALLHVAQTLPDNLQRRVKILKAICGSLVFHVVSQETGHFDVSCARFEKLYKTIVTHNLPTLSSSRVKERERRLL